MIFAEIMFGLNLSRDNDNILLVTYMMNERKYVNN
jgi:hypothetical protein